MTRRSFFAANGDVFRDDYPRRGTTATVAFARGTHPGYRFNSAGQITGTRNLALTAVSTAPATDRARIAGRGIYYRISAGSLSGYWVAEAYPTRYMRALYAQHAYALPRKAELAAGTTHRGYTYDSGSRVTSTRSATFTRMSTASFDRSAWINGRLHIRMINGLWEGYWLVVTSGVTLR
jgi:hypothetical protein